MRRLAPYLAFARTAFSREATYRAEVVVGVLSLVVRVYLIRSIWTALYAHNAAPANLPLHAIVTYATVALLMSLVLEVDGTRLIRDKLRDGTIATDLMKPISLPAYFFSDGIGQAAFHALSIGPALLCALLLVHVDRPSAPAFAAFVVTFAIGYGVNFLLNFLMNSIAFWTLETFALQLVVRWASDLLSGQIVPLSLFPGRLGDSVLALPFASIYSTPLRIFVGQLPPRAWPGAVALQLFWLAVFALVATFTWRAARSRVVVQGG